MFLPYHMIRSRSQSPPILNRPRQSLFAGILMSLLEEDEQQTDTIEHIESDSDDLEILEAEAENVRTRRK